MSKGDREIHKADCDDGYTRIANLLLEALALARLNAVQKGVCLFLFRRTYGWNRNEDAIFLGEFAEACGTSRVYIARAVNELLEKNIICRLSYQPGKTSVYSFVTRIADWDQSCINLADLDKNAEKGLYVCSQILGKVLHDTATNIMQGLQECTTPLLNDCTTVLLNDCTTPLLNDCATVLLNDCLGVNQEPSLEPPKLAAIVKTEKKKVKERYKYPPDSLPYQLSELLLNKILERLPNYRKPDLQKWAWQMDAIMRLDRRAPEELKAVILFAQDDFFWQNNIMSVEKLRKQYDQLNAKRLQPRASPTARRYQSPKLNGEEADEYKGFFQ